jgi:hypothetical protein
MNEPSTLEAQLQETRQAIVLHEQAMAASPSPALSASLQSLQKRLERLEGLSRTAENGTSALLHHVRDGE